MNLGAKLANEPGVLHTTAVWQPALRGQPPRVLRILDSTPKSETDGFVLAAARARAHAILTSGRILREEPTLRHDLAGPRAVELRRFRAEILGLDEPPRVAVLSRGSDLDPDHPAFGSSTKAVLLVPESAADAVAERFSGRNVEVVGRARPSARDALEWLAGPGGAETVLVELGPSTSPGLYDDPVCVDELLLSSYLGPSPPEAVIGGEFVPRERIAEIFGSPVESFEREEESGRWRFERYRCTPASDRNAGATAASRSPV